MSNEYRLNPEAQRFFDKLLRGKPEEQPANNQRHHDEVASRCSESSELDDAINEVEAVYSMVVDSHSQACVLENEFAKDELSGIRIALDRACQRLRDTQTH